MPWSEYARNDTRKRRSVYCALAAKPIDTKRRQHRREDDNSSGKVDRLIALCPSRIVARSNLDSVALLSLPVRKRLTSRSCATLTTQFRRSCEPLVVDRSNADISTR